MNFYKSQDQNVWLKNKVKQKEFTEKSKNFYLSPIKPDIKLTAEDIKNQKKFRQERKITDKASYF